MNPQLINILTQLKAVCVKLLAILQSKETNVKPMSDTSVDVLNPDWSIPANARHNVRVLCDLAGLTLYSKNVVTACIEVESGFHLHAKNENKDVEGRITSSDWGIVQVNDYFHIGAGKDFPSVDYVLTHPQQCVEWMIKMMKEGHINLWSSYTSGAYRKFMP
jgi:hypothetical protein